MTIEYSGEFENQIRAAKTLRFIVPSVLFIIFVLLYSSIATRRKLPTSFSPCRSL